jgi:hypothetical protein
MWPCHLHLNTRAMMNTIHFGNAWIVQRNAFPLHIEESRIEVIVFYKALIGINISLCRATFLIAWLHHDILKMFSTCEWIARQFWNEGTIMIQAIMLIKIMVRHMWPCHLHLNTRAMMNTIHFGNAWIVQRNAFPLHIEESRIEVIVFYKALIGINISLCRATFLIAWLHHDILKMFSTCEWIARQFWNEGTIMIQAIMDRSRPAPVVVERREVEEICRMMSTS